MLFKVSFLIFAILAMSYRMWDSFVNNKERNGQKYLAWTLSAIFIISWAIFLGTFVELIVVPRKINYFISTISLAVFIPSLFLRSYAKKQLGVFYSNHIKIYADHRLVKIGLYKQVRHPYYIFFIFEAISFPLIANAYFTFCIGITLFIPLIIFRASYEDQMLNKHFGNEFTEYKRSTGTFLPLRIFRL